MRRVNRTVTLIWGHPRFAWRVARAYRAPVAPAEVARLAGRLMAMDLFKLAERLLKRGLERTPESFELLEQHALCAHNSGHHREALRRWRHLREAWPDAPMAWCGIASNARELRCIDEASAAITEALSRFPDDYIIISEGARIREAEKAHAEAADLWTRMLEHPTPAAAWRVSLARNLLMLQRYDEVERVLAELPATPGTRFGGARRQAAHIWAEATVDLAHENQWLLVPSLREVERRYGDEAFAVEKIAETTGNLPGAREALCRLLESAPADLEARECYVRVLTRSDRLDEAEREIEAGLRLRPRHERLRALRGLIAMRKQDWASAEAAWKAYAKKHPQDATAEQFITRLRLLRDLQAAAEPGAAVRPAPIAPELHDDPELRRLVLSFEGVGSTCEFGAVQRRYGAEPLGLLRWTGTDAKTLMAAIAADFAGMGDAANTELTVGPLGEVYISDTRWNLPMHTFLYESEVSLGDLLPKMCRRTAFLRDKFLNDVREGEKTLVFKNEDVTESELVTLHDAFRRLGPVRLLHVRLAAASRGFAYARPGTAVQLRPGLYVGRVSRTSLKDTPFDEWIDVCKAVERLGGLARDADVVDMDPPMALAHGGEVLAIVADDMIAPQPSA